MSRTRKPKVYNPQLIIEEIEKMPNPFFDDVHNLTITIKGRARSNQTRKEHIAQYGHDLKVRDIALIVDSSKKIVFYKYKKDKNHKDTYNYYIKRKGEDKGFIKVSIQISKQNKKKAWVKTIFITNKIK